MTFLAYHAIALIALLWVIAGFCMDFIENDKEFRE